MGQSWCFHFLPSKSIKNIKKLIERIQKLWRSSLWTLSGPCRCCNCRLCPRFWHFRVRWRPGARHRERRQVCSRHLWEGDLWTVTTWAFLYQHWRMIIQRGKSKGDGLLTCQRESRESMQCFSRVVALLANEFVGSLLRLVTLGASIQHLSCGTRRRIPLWTMNQWTF